MDGRAFDACEDEIDLRELALTLWRGKWVVLLVTAAAALAALLVSLALPKEYKASTYVALHEPTLQAQAAGALALAVQVPDVKSAVSLAESPEVFQAVVANPQVRNAWREDQPLTWEVVARKVRVQSAGERGVQLEVRDTDPARAALIANVWGREVVDRINASYGVQSMVGELQERLQAAQEAYRQAQERYEQALAQSQAAALQKQLAQANSDLACLLARTSDIQRLQGDLETFQGYLKTRAPDAPLTAGDALALTTLQQRVLATKVCATDTANIQVQIGSAALTALTISEAQALLDHLSAVLQARTADTQARQAALSQRIPHLQQAAEKAQAQLQEAAAARDQAWQNYKDLRLLEEQGETLAMDENQVATLAGRAETPTSPSSPRTAMNVALAAVVGMMVGVMGVFMAGWWKDEEAERSDD